MSAHNEDQALNTDQDLHPIMVTTCDIELRSNLDIDIIQDPVLHSILTNIIAQKKEAENRRAQKAHRNLGSAPQHQGPSAQTDQRLRELLDDMLGAYSRKDVVGGATVLCKVLQYLAPGQTSIAHMVSMYGEILEAALSRKS